MMKFDPVVVLYLIFLAVILISNQLKKRRRQQQRAEDRSSSPQHDHRYHRKPVPAPAPPPIETRRPKTNLPARGKADAAQALLHHVSRRQPAPSARFKTRDDLRRAVVARVVLGPPRSLD